MKRYQLDDDTYEYIKEIACHTISYNKVKCIPVCGFEIAAKLRITMIPYSSLSAHKLDAALRVSKDGFYVLSGMQEIIYYNDINISYERQNMTILHEIGHIQLDHNGEDCDKEEAEARFFTKYIIAPPLIHTLRPSTFYDIYDHFDISLVAASYAYEYYQKWLNIHKKMNNKYKTYEQILLGHFNESSSVMKGGDEIV